MKILVIGGTGGQGRYLVPGFTDAHTHGKVGYDFNTVSADKIPEVLIGYAKKGVTSLFPTLASATLEELLAMNDQLNRIPKP